MRIQIESPFAGDTKRNIAYAKRALRYALDAGFAPMASHLLYTQVLDDTDPEQRKQGIDAALMYAEQADQIWVFEDYGITPGMAQAINAGANNDTPIVFMTIGKNKRFTSGEYDLEPCQLEHARPSRGSLLAPTVSASSGSPS